MEHNTGGQLRVSHHEVHYPAVLSSQFLYFDIVKEIAIYTPMLD